MSQFILDGIQFTADNSTLKTAGAKTVKFGNVENGDFADATTDGVVPFVNAVEIDWNGAQIADTTVNTTGQLLNIINELNNKVNLLTDNVGFDPNTIELTVPNNSYHSYSTGVGYTLYGNNAYLDVTATLSYIYNNVEYNTSNKIVGWKLGQINHTTHDSYFTFEKNTISGNANTIGLNMTGTDLSYLTHTLRIESFTFIAASATNSMVSAPIDIKIKDGRVGEFTTDIIDIEATDTGNDGSSYFTYGVIKVSNITHNCFSAPKVNISISTKDNENNNNTYIRLVDPENVNIGSSIDNAYMVHNVELPSAGKKTIYCYTCLTTHNSQTYPDSHITVPITISLVNNDSYSFGETKYTVSFYRNSTTDVPDPSSEVNGDESKEEEPV